MILTKCPTYYSTFILIKSFKKWKVANKPMTVWNSHKKAPNLRLKNFDASHYCKAFLEPLTCKCMCNSRRQSSHRYEIYLISPFRSYLCRTFSEENCYSLWKSERSDVWCNIYFGGKPHLWSGKCFDCQNNGKPMCCT